MGDSARTTMGLHETGLRKPAEKGGDVLREPLDRARETSRPGDTGAEIGLAWQAALFGPRRRH